MTDFRITRGGDIELYIGAEQLFGVTDFRSKAAYESHPVREYLSGEPYAVVNEKTAVEIRMSVLSLFRYAALEEAPFTFRLVDGNTEYLYEGCTVAGRERSVHAGKAVVDEYVITAKKMRKQVHRNAE